MQGLGQTGNALALYDRSPSVFPPGDLEFTSFLRVPEYAGFDKTSVDVHDSNSYH